MVTQEAKGRATDALETAAAEQAELKQACRDVMLTLSTRIKEPRLAALRFSGQALEKFIKDLISPYTKKSVQISVRILELTHEFLDASDEFDEVEFLSDSDGFSWFIKVDDNGADIVFVLVKNPTSQKLRELTRKPATLNW